jgi:hypothetical protein
MARGGSEIDYWSWIFFWHWENWLQVSIILIVGVLGGWLTRKLTMPPQPPIRP